MYTLTRSRMCAHAHPSLHGASRCPTRGSRPPAAGPSWSRAGARRSPSRSTKWLSDGPASVRIDVTPNAFSLLLEFANRVHRGPAGAPRATAVPGGRRPRPWACTAWSSSPTSKCPRSGPTSRTSPPGPPPLPEVVKGAVVRPATCVPDKSLRRLFLDEFVSDLDLTGDLTVDATVGPRRAAGALRARVHPPRRRLRRRSSAACAPRVRAVVEPAHQTPRVGSADGVPRAVDASHPLRRPRGRYLHDRDSVVLADRELGDGATSPTWTRSSRPIPEMLPTLVDWDRERYPKDPADSHFVYKQTIKAKACDAARGILPAATLSNVGTTAPARRSRRCCCACVPTRCPRPAATRPPCSRSSAR